MTDGTTPSNPSMPKGFYKLKDDVEHECPADGSVCPMLYWKTGFKYRVVPPKSLVDYLTEKGFTGLDFNIDRI